MGLQFGARKPGQVFTFGTVTGTVGAKPPPPPTAMSGTAVEGRVAIAGGSFSDLAPPAGRGARFMAGRDAVNAGAAKFLAKCGVMG